MTTTNLTPAGASVLDYASARAPRPLWQSPTLHNWIKAFLCTLGIIVVCLGFYYFDKYQGFFEFRTRRLSEYRMFRNPTTMPMRIFGIPHFFIAVAFLMSSRRMKERRNWLVFSGLAVIGVFLCLFFKQAGANLSPFAVFLFYFYFLVHGFRDDAHFYKTYGDMPADGLAIHTRVIRVLQLLLIGLLFSMFWPTYAHMSEAIYHRTDPILSSFFPSDWRFATKLFSMFVPMVLIALAALHRITRQLPDGWPGLWRTHRPILMVYLLSLSVLALAMVGGPAAFDIWVLNHFVVWYIFTIFLLNRRPAPKGDVGLWTWMRTTRRGFTTLHHCLAGVVTVMMCVSVYVYGQKDSAFDWIVGKESFYYWTIMHVTLSFVPR